jgi:hypothetical protein
MCAHGCAFTFGEVFSLKFSKMQVFVNNIQGICLFIPKEYFYLGVIMNFKIRSYFLSLSLLYISSTAVVFAGGTTAGGGDTTLPQKVDASRIVEISQIDSGFAIKSFFIAKKDLYDSLSLDEQRVSPYFKIFGEGKNIFSAVDNASVELKMYSACLDFDGLEKEGSVNADQKSDICISPFLMSKKLDKYNVTPETIGLIVHELTHLLGTDENEAVLSNFLCKLVFTLKPRKGFLKSNWVSLPVNFHSQTNHC